MRTRWLAVALLWPITTAVAESRPYPITEERTACSAYEPFKRPFFGDTHVHTAFSFDANTQDTRITPDEAYRFARGEAHGIQPYDVDGKATRSAQLRRPLDFTALTDHAELLGEVRICTHPGLPGSESDLCWVYQQQPIAALLALANRAMVDRERFHFCGKDGARCLQQSAAVWKEIQDAAEVAYDRSAACSFTSFGAYEFTGSTDANLHRNVIFRNAKVPDQPPSWVEMGSAYRLWEELQKECVDGIPGCDVLTIPHNSNLSGPGMMFETAKLRSNADVGAEVTLEEARLRQRWEPLAEVMQHKGDSECLLGGDTTDEACGFEKLPSSTFQGVGAWKRPNAPAPDARGMVRDALKKGLVLEQKLGVNPLKYGLIASTDTHLGTPGLVQEDDGKGHGGAGSRTLRGLPDDLEFNPGGLAVLWAEENSRDSLFAAMQRREVYGTSGPRPVVRFFGGWEYADDLCADPAFVERGYAGGVPMGGDLPKAPADGAPRFAVRAAQDPGTRAVPGTPLQRIQIVKGWVEGGKAREKVYDVAGGDNGASVDTATCERKGKGAAQLCAVWIDPDFDASENAFYYARVLENPSCRWSQQLCVEAGVDCSDPSGIGPGYEACCAAEHRPTIRERAWTSPIWHRP